MKYSLSKRFTRSFAGFPEIIQRKFEKQLIHLLANIKHPSLHAKKFDESLGIWQARIDRNVRFYFLVEEDTYILLDIQKHAK